MSAPPHNDTLQPGVFSGSVQTPVSRPPASSRELRASKRVCFYKSGDPQFSGHRIVINSRTFKTFDALLDALSKKVPLPFGVRTITTPKGTHAIQNLDDLRDGASYVCSDQRRVKPLNLDEVNRRQVPWNTTRPPSSGRQGRRGLIRQLVKKNEVVRTAKVMNTPVAVWTPKRLVVFKNRDPTTKRTVVLQRRTAPTFEALLDYLSQMLQFPVVKLYTADGRRVEGLPALILCSGTVVAAGNEPFRLSDYNFQGSSQPSQSAISESIGPAKTQPLPKDDIEKSFRVNQDGSMTVEMKVRLTLKQEEMIHWTTTLSRTCANSQQRAVCSQPGYFPYSNDYSAKQAKRDSRDSKEDNTPTEKSVGLNEEGEDHCGSATSETLEKPKPAFRRLPTPGPRRVRRKEASVENIKRVSQSEVQESTVGAYSYMERTADGELTEGYCVVSHSSSSSTRPVPKPRKNSSGEAKHKKTHSSVRSSRMAEVLQLQNNGTEITETVMRIYESQGTYENYFANTPITADKKLELKAKTKECRNPDSTDSGPRSSSNDCDVDLTRQSISSDSQNARKSELLSLSSGQSSPSQKINKNLSSCKNSEKQARPESSHKGLVDPEACTKENSEDTTTERLVSHPPVQIRCEGEPVETQRIKSFCKSMPSVRIYPAEQDSRIRMNKSSEALVPIQPDEHGETSQTAKVNTRSGMKPILQQLCLSIQSIRRTSSHSHLTSLEKEKSSSLPDFSSQVASVFGSPSKALLSFLSVMTLKDGVSSTSNEDPALNSGSYPEALQVMQSLEKLASIEDEEELKASLASLQRSASPQLNKSWRDFQERNDVELSPPLSPRQSEQEFALEVDSEGEDQVKEHHFGIKELMDELNMSEDLRREISSLVDGEPTNTDTEKLTNTATDIASENEDVTTKDNFLDPEGGFSEVRASHDDTITRVEKATQSEETCREESCPPDSASKALVLEKCDIENVQTVEEETSQTDLLDMGDSVQTTDEKYTENASCQVGEPEVPDHTQNNLDEKKVPDSVFNSECVETEHRSHTSETYRANLGDQHSEVNDDQDSETKEDNEEDDRNVDLGEHIVNAEVDENDTFTNQDQYELDENQEAELQNNAIIQQEDFSVNEEVYKSEEEEQNHDKFKSEDAESQPKELDLNYDSESHNSCDSEKLAPESPNDHNISIEEDARSEALQCSVDDANSDANNDSPMEEEDDNENKDTVSKAESHHSSISNQDIKQADKTKTESCTSPGSESGHELQTLEQEDIIEEQICSVEEIDEEAGEDKWSDALDSDKDFDAESNYPAMSDQDGECSDQDKTLSGKSQESEAEQELQTLEEKNITEEKDEEDEHEDKQSNALDSEKGLNSEPEPNYPAASEQDTEKEVDDEDFDAELNYPAMSDHKESEAEHERWTKKQEKQTSSAEDKDDEEDEHVDKQSKATDSDKDVNIPSNHSYMPDPETKHPVWRDSCNSQDTEAYIAQSEDTEGVEEAEGCLCVHPMEISQELLDFVNFALLSSALTFKYDSNGCLRIEPDKCKIRETSLVERNVDSQCVQRRLPSPNTSDLSDYRPETSDSGGNISQVSTDLFTETGEEDVERLSTYQGIMKPCLKNGKRCDKVLDNSSTKTNSGADTKHTASASLKSVNSLASFHDSIANGTIQEPAKSNTSGSFNEDSEPVQCTVFYSEADFSEGILIDKGRWLLKENHLIRKSPPVPMGMYENVDTTSADTGQDNTSEEAPYPPCGTQPSPLAVISSSELEEMAKPPTPKCTYFNMPHNSDSDPFLDNQSINSSKGGGDIRKYRELKVSPMDETSKTWAKKNGSLPSFASVEFKLPDGKVHPEGDLASGVVEKTTRSQSISSRAAQEEESVEGLNLRCGRHCPIL
ncbi:hypothetical protein MHYP_G00006940 [Metynnis hypsauchen]